MNLTIKRLMEKPKDEHDLAWLQNSLQAAVELELSTLPPYLCGLYTLENPKSEAATLIKGIVFDEMRHFGIACNLLRATGAQPEIFAGYDNIVYPGPLPGGVRPKCDPTLRLPCDPNFEVVLGFSEYRSFVKMCMQIEYPEDPVPRPAALVAAEESYPTIGQFYDAVRDAFKDLGPKVPYVVDKQLENAGPALVKIVRVETAIEQISLIQAQGEGAAKFPFVDPAGTKLAHFYTFGEIFFGQHYVYDATAKTGDWNGSRVDVPAAYPMTQVPLGGYGAGAPPEVGNCDLAFTQLLLGLDKAWANGDRNSLRDAIGSMDELRDAALDLMNKQVARPEGGNFGPQFRKVAI